MYITENRLLIAALNRFDVFMLKYVKDFSPVTQYTEYTSPRKFEEKFPTQNKRTEEEN